VNRQILFFALVTFLVIVQLGIDVYVVTGGHK